MKKTAVMVDGAFYLKRAYAQWGEKTPEQRAKEMWDYCRDHIVNEESDLYRIFYYDCEPIQGSMYHPLTKKNVNLAGSETYQWKMEFLQELRTKRKTALRMGELVREGNNFVFSRNETVKDLYTGKTTLKKLKERDFKPALRQKGVDMRIGLDIASVTYKKQANQIILISGDSDFVPAAKLARREGMDFILDPMWQNIKDDLFEHIDGIHSPNKKRK